MARLITWEPAREVAALHSEMSRLVSGLLDGDGRRAQSWAPAVDVWETGSELVYSFDLPGVPEDRISLELEDGTLTVSAVRERSEEVQTERVYRAERRFGSFVRTLGLPQGVTEEDITAHAAHGVLEVHVRKPQERKPRKIEIGRAPAARPVVEGAATEAQAA